MPRAYRLSLLGLRDTERETLHSCLRLLRERTPHYEIATRLDECDLVIADADHPPSVQLVAATERQGCTVFVGSAAPQGAAAFVERPMDVRLLLRELDALVAQNGPAPQAALRRVVQERRRQPAPAAPAAPAVAPPVPTALLVDDSEVALRFLETHLQRWGLLMDRALSSGRAIELLAQRHYDFVFLDVELGPASDLDGLALCHHIKRRQDAGSPFPTTVVLVSAHAGETDRVRGTLAGCDGYLAKPLDEAELRRLMLRHGLRQRAAAAPQGH